ncbi:MAG TPA: hypothetical protein VLR88_11665, partial [Propionibacteriaceae bacterium]|nr:hypothetical protein [Propionibacteriaceae bacterium]
MAVILLAMTLSACGLVSSPARAVPAQFVEQATITEAAIVLVGVDKAKQAAEEATSFAMETGFNPALLNPAQTSYTEGELNPTVIQQALAPGAYTLWSQLVSQAAGGNRDAQEEVRGLEMFGLQQPTWQPNPDGKILYAQTISEVVVDVLAVPRPAVVNPTSVTSDATPTLEVTFTHEARLRFTEDKRPFEAIFTRSVAYTMVPSNSARGRELPDKITFVTATPVIPVRPGSTASSGSTIRVASSPRPAVAPGAPPVAPVTQASGEST